MMGPRLDPSSHEIPESKETAPMRRRQGFGCLQIILTLVALTIIIGLAGGYYVYTHAGDWFRGGAAFLVEEMSKEMFEKLDLTPDERAAARAPLDELAKDIRENKVSMKEAEEITKELAEGPLPVALTALALESNYLEKSTLPPEEKKEGQLTAHRYVRGLLDGKISKEKYEEVEPIVSETNTKIGADGKQTTEVKLKDKLTDDELRKALALMKRDADAAEIATENVTIEVGAVIRGSIEKGRARAREAASTGSTPAGSAGAGAGAASSAPVAPASVAAPASAEAPASPAASPAGP